MRERWLKKKKNWDKSTPLASQESKEELWFQTSWYLATSDGLRHLARVKPKACCPWFLPSSVLPCLALRTLHDTRCNSSWRRLSLTPSHFPIPCHPFSLCFKMWKGTFKMDLGESKLGEGREWILLLIFCVWPWEKNFSSLSLSSLIHEDGGMGPTSFCCFRCQ